MIWPKKDPHSVFTPRAASVNKEMYVDRSDLEARLGELVRGSKHIIIHGESGNGKTWLYKKVFAEERTPYATVNLANASRFGSIEKAISEKIKKTKGNEKALSQIVVQTEARVTPAGVGASINNQKIYEVVEQDSLLALMMLVRAKGGRRPGLIVFDNFETVLESDALISELANMLVLLDDDDYAEYGVKICIVGVPAEIRDYITKLSSVQTLSNRMVELPEVARLTGDEADLLVKKGLMELLGLEIDTISEAFTRIQWSTDRIAQYLHELGLEVALIAQKNNEVVNSDVIERAEGRWFETSISAVRQIVDTNLNARETKAGRRNQVIYALGCIKTEDFKYSDVEAVVRQEFPDSTEGVELNIIQRLGELEKGTHPIVKRVPKGDAYRVINPKVKIAIRVMLRKVNGRVEKVPFIS
ncbi:MAG: hypothetical protein AUK37_01275 [Rhodobacterales bacterium CG2_30_65_12]|nr:MAG: hypothetical protein AUK37_01275 [Rhodobacterales bacterium CG2_30_65_12]